MKRRDLIRHLEAHGCEFLREGANHTVYVNRVTQKSAAVPRHREIKRIPGAEDLPRLANPGAAARLVSNHSGSIYLTGSRAALKLMLGC